MHAGSNNSSNILGVGDYLIVKPSLKTKTAYVFQIAGLNNLTDTIDVHLPLAAGTPCKSFTSGTVNAPADHVLPAFSFTDPPVTLTLKALQHSLVDPNDMFSMRLTAPSYPDILFYYCIRTVPNWIRIIMEAPPGTTQRFFQADRIALNIDGPFGYNRGYVETVQPSALKYFWVFGNDTNLAVHTHLKVEYAEYRVAPVQNAEVVFSLLNPIVDDYRGVPVPVVIRNRRVKRVQIPLTNMDSQTEADLRASFGTIGYPLRYNNYSEAIRIIQEETSKMMNALVRYG
jgi:hypothetical protein